MSDRVNTAKCKMCLGEALQLNMRHMEGTEPVTTQSLMQMMQLLRLAIQSLMAGDADEGM